MQVGPDVIFEGNVADAAGALSIEDNTLVVREPKGLYSQIEDTIHTVYCH